MSKEPHRVLIVDDHPMFREGLMDLLRTAEDIEVTAAAANSDDAVEAAVEQQPDLVIMDLQMPRSDGDRATHDNGLDAIRLIREKVPNAHILVLTAFEDADLVRRALAAGARGYCPKQSNGTQILDALRLVVQGGLAASPEIAGEILRLIRQPPRNSYPEPFSQLTKREFEIVTLVTQGKSNLEIAKALHVEAKTVANNLTTIYRRLDLNRSQLIAAAHDKGIGV